MTAEQPTLALCMIVRDESHFLDDCLMSARPFVDEIVVADTGSTDNTPEIAARYADRVAGFTWVEDFSAARNFSLSLASSDWCLVLDADEVIEPEGYGAIRALLTDSGYDGYMLTHANYADEPGARRRRVEAGNLASRGHQWVSYMPILRLFRRRESIFFEGSIHEVVDQTIPSERVQKTDILIHHYLHDNPQRPRRDRLRRYVSMMEKSLESRPDGRLSGILAASLLALGEDFESAAGHYMEAARLGYRPIESLEGAALAHYKGGSFAAARALYADLYERGFRHPSVAINLANLEVRFSRANRAIEILSEVLKSDQLSSAQRERVMGNIKVLQSSA